MPPIRQKAASKPPNMGLVLDIKITGDEVGDVLHQVIWGERVALVHFEIFKEKKTTEDGKYLHMRNSPGY